MSVELFFDTYEKGLAVELMFDMYEEGSALRGVVSTNGAYVRARRVANQPAYSGFVAVADRTWQSHNRWAADVDFGREPSSIGLSPYTLGGGDPINNAWKEFSPAEEQLKGNPRH